MSILSKGNKVPFYNTFKVLFIKPSELLCKCFMYVQNIKYNRTENIDVKNLMDRCKCAVFRQVPSVLIFISILITER